MSEMNECFSIEDLGDGLFRQGGDIFCSFPILSFERTETETAGTAVYEYEKYTVKVTYEIDGSKRKNPHWLRTYKEAIT